MSVQSESRPARRYIMLLFSAGLVSILPIARQAESGVSTSATVARSLLPGLNRHDHRTVVDPTRPPWNVIVKVQTNIGGKCTGFVIDRRSVLTAAHCLWNPRTRTMLRPISLHVLFGYRRDQYTKHVLVSGYRLAPASDDGPPQRRPGADWVRLDLAEAFPAGLKPLPLDADFPRLGTPVVLAGYNQDRSQLLLADLACRIIGRATRRGAQFLVHNCSATRGTSGAPLLLRRKNGYAVLGMNIAASPRGNLALPSADFLSAID